VLFGSVIADFLDKTVEARFKRDAEGRLLFFPAGAGSGRIVPDAATEARLRAGSRRYMVVMFAVIVPIVSILSTFFRPQGLHFLVYMAACLGLGIASMVYPMWLAHGLVKSRERLSCRGAVLHSLDSFGTRFLVFGLATSLLLSVLAAIMLAYRPARAEADPTAMVVCLLIFVPFSLAYAVALVRRWRGSDAAS
jgi:hypothetical protein